MENRFHYEPDTSIARLAASLGWGLIKHHVFLDGNKRIGLGAMVTFLEINAHRFTCPETRVKDIVLRAAASELSESAWLLWMEQNILL